MKRLVTLIVFIFFAYLVRTDVLSGPLYESDRTLYYIVKVMEILILFGFIIYMERKTIQKKFNHLKAKWNNRGKEIEEPFDDDEDDEDEEEEKLEEERLKRKQEEEEMLKNVPMSQRIKHRIIRIAIIISTFVVIIIVRIAVAMLGGGESDIEKNLPSVDINGMNGIQEAESLVRHRDDLESELTHTADEINAYAKSKTEKLLKDKGFACDKKSLKSKYSKKDFAKLNNLNDVQLYSLSVTVDEDVMDRIMGARGYDSYLAYKMDIINNFNLEKDNIYEVNCMRTLDNEMTSKGITSSKEDIY